MQIKFRLLMTSIFTVFFISGCGGGGGNTPTTPIPPVNPPADTIAPVISLAGAATIAHEQGMSFSDPGASATDNVDGTVTVTVSGAVDSAAGSYTLTYSAIDAAGNSASVTRIVVVADTTSPILTLNGSATLNHEQNTPYVDAGATATDSIDGNITVTTTGSVGSELGSYTLTFTATDAAGNSASKTRTVVVIASPPAGNETDLKVLAEGQIAPIWDKGINAFDAAINYGECNNDGGAGCPSIDWAFVNDEQRGDVLQVTHSASGNLAGLFIAINGVVDLADYSAGSLIFDIKVVSGDSKITMKLDCIYPCTSGDQALGSKGAAGWETVEVPLQTLVTNGLNLSSVNTGIVIWATDATSTVFRLDNIRFSGIVEGGQPPTGGTDPGDYNIIPYGLGSVSDTINPDSYRCVFDYGNWIYNAGIVEPAIAGCNVQTGIPSGTPAKLHPHLTGPAATKPTPSHKWWGSIPFMGEMTVGDANDSAYITPDPITARITNKGVRVMGIPSGMKTLGNDFLYQIPDPFNEVFDGIAVANSLNVELKAYLKDYSDGSVTVEWQNNGTAVMQATFVHGSPYIYFKAFDGNLLLRTTRADGGEKGTFYQQGNSLGVWTNVAGNHNNYLITGEGDTTFTNVSSNEITVSNTAKELTLTYLPQLSSVPNDSFVSFFEAKARNIVSAVSIDYSVDRSTNNVTVEHHYLDALGAAVDTIVGMMPLHWKNSSQVTSSYKVRSARGMIKFSETSGFSYQLPYVGVLPALPTLPNSFEQATIEALVSEFTSQAPTVWNDRTDAYWAGKNYSKVSDLIVIADAVGMTAEATALRDWLKTELADWFTANNNGGLDTNKYFVYDQEWSTLLALEESFSSHQQLNDHHFHYGYLVRAAAEVCRVDAAWCGADQYGPMIELLIRDYAGGRNDDMFPYLRNFDPANGFSWASGKVNFVRGNNNESTSEAANAYGAIVLYGMITGNDDLTERGIYLHASTTAAYWEYWNNIDGYNNVGADENNFPANYNRITTSIIWGDGAVFSTWFSGAFAHILGIQGLPSNTLNLHIGLHANYLEDYVALGLSESANGKPSGLIADQWRDIWWNIWSMTDANAVIADYESADNYVAEAGETKAHTYHWMHTFKQLGHLMTGDGALTADYPAATAFDNNGVITYVVYNFSDQAITVNYSDGQIVNAAASGFTVVSN
jgi:endo-1,3(4)-beta-glucanase